MAHDSAFDFPDRAHGVSHSCSNPGVQQHNLYTHKARHHMETLKSMQPPPSP